MTDSQPARPPAARPWFREPSLWLVIGLPAAAVIASFVTLGLAIRGSDDVVRDDFRKEGLSIHPDPRRDAAAATLGARAHVAIDGIAGIVVVSLEVSRGTRPGSLLLILSHATRSDLDRLVRLELRDGEWRGASGTLPDGHWYAELTPGDRAWRLTGEFRGATAGLDLAP